MYANTFLDSTNAVVSHAYFVRWCFRCYPAFKNYLHNVSKTETTEHLR